MLHAVKERLMYKVFVLRSTKSGQVRTVGYTRGKLDVKRRELLEQDQKFDSLWWLSRGLKLQGYTLEIEQVDTAASREEAQDKVEQIITQYKKNNHPLTNTDIDKNKEQEHQEYLSLSLSLSTLRTRISSSTLALSR